MLAKNNIIRILNGCVVKLLLLFTFFVYGNLEARVLPFNYFNVDYNKCMDEEIVKIYNESNETISSFNRYGKKYEDAYAAAYEVCSKKALDICNASYFRMSEPGNNLFTGNDVYKRVGAYDNMPTGEEYKIYEKCHNYYAKLKVSGAIEEFKCKRSEYLNGQVGRCKIDNIERVKNKYGPEFVNNIFYGFNERGLAGCHVCLEKDEDAPIVSIPQIEVIKADYEHQPNKIITLATPENKCAKHYLPDVHSDPIEGICGHVIDYGNECKGVRKRNGKCYGLAGLVEWPTYPKDSMIYPFLTKDGKCEICTEVKETIFIDQDSATGVKNKEPMMEWSMACHEDGFGCDEGTRNNRGKAGQAIREQELKGSKFSGYQNKINQLKPRFIPNSEFSNLNEYTKGLTQGVVYGDFLSTGASVIKGTFNITDYFDNKTKDNGKFIQESSNDAYKFTRKFIKDFSTREYDNESNLTNASSAELKLPTIKDKEGKIINIEGKDIVYARLYWQGMIYSSTDTAVIDAQAKYKDFYQAIEGYRNVAIQVGDMEPIKLTSSMEDTYGAYSYSPFITNVAQQADVVAKNRMGFRMFYSASADVTDIIRENFDKSRKITVGGIKTSVPMDMWCVGSCADIDNTKKEIIKDKDELKVRVKNFIYSRGAWQLTDEEKERLTNGIQNIIDEECTEPNKCYLYQARWKAQNYIENENIENKVYQKLLIPAVIRMMPLSGAKRTFSNNEKIKMYNFKMNEWTDEVVFPSYGGWSLFVIYNNEDKFEPKSIALYDGFTYDMTDAKPSTGSTSNQDDGIGALTQELEFNGIYTPDVDKREGKVGYFLSSLASKDNSGLQIKGRSETEEGAYTEVFGEIAKERSQFIPSYTYIDYDKNKYIQKNIHNDNKTPMLSMDNYDITDKLVKESTTAWLKFETKAIGTVKVGPAGLIRRTNIISPGSMFISTVAFSTDIYKPEICYVENVYNQAGRKDTFTVTKGEVLNNRITFKNRSTGKNKRPAKGVVVEAYFEEKNAHYNENTSKIDNTLKYKSFTHPFRDKLVYLKDGEEGAYTTPFKKDKAGNIIEYGDKSSDLTYVGKTLNTYDGDLTFYLGRGAGNMKDGTILGGILNNEEASYIEYDTTIDKRFVANKFLLNFSFEVNGNLIAYKKKNNFIERCDNSSGDKNITVISLGGLKVANQNYVVDTDDENNSKSTLYTQVGKKDFNVTLVYEADFSHKTEENPDGGYWLYGPDGKDPKPITKEEYDKLKKSEKFIPKGILELSLVTRSRIQDRGCKEITTTPLDSMPFVWKNCPKNKVTIEYLEGNTTKEEEIVLNSNKDCSKLNYSYQVSFENDKNSSLSGKQVMLTGLDIGYARKDYTFVLTYTPSGAKKGDLDKNLTQDIENYKKCLIEENVENVDCEELKKKYKKDNDILDGSVLNDQGAFVTCRPEEVFVLRPAYFKSDLNSSKVRVAGDPNENIDILNRGIYPADYNGDFLPGYYKVMQKDRLYTIDEVEAKTIPVLAVGCTAQEVRAINKITKAEDTVWYPSFNLVKANFGFLKSDGSFDENYNALEINRELSSYEKGQKIDPRYATIYTDENTVSREKYFNYYNIGDANLSIIDNDWTSEDQEKGDCDVNSSRSIADKFGKVGCNTAVSDEITKGATQKDALLRFRHNDVILNIKNLSSGRDQNYTFFSNDANSMGARLNINAKARTAENELYEPITVTLYNRNCYARDINFALDFTYDCDSASSDFRCGNIGDSRQYRTFDGGSIKKGLLTPIIFGTDMGMRHAKVNATDFRATTASKIDLKTRFDHNISKNRISAFTIEREAFESNGIGDSNISINFMRANNIANNPVMLVAEDFVENSGFTARELALPTDVAPDTNGLNTKGIFALNTPVLQSYSRDTTRDGTINSPINGVAYFYYGNANAERLKYVAREGSDINVDVYSMVYCDDGGDGRCTRNDNTNHFKILKDNNTTITDRPNFFVNKKESYIDNLKIKDFVDSYGANKYFTDVNITRGDRLDNTTNYSEKLNITSAKAPLSDFINVNTHDWFIYDANINATYNQFEIEFLPNPNSQWGGEGGVKSGDSVGIFLDSNKSDAPASIGSGIRKNRLNW